MGRKFYLSPELYALCHHFLPGPFLKKGDLLAKIKLLPDGQPDHT